MAASKEVKNSNDCHDRHREARGATIFLCRLIHQSYFSVAFVLFDAPPPCLATDRKGGARIE